MTVQVPHKKFTIGQYHQVIESGILTDRVELLQEEIIGMSLISRQHAVCIDCLAELWARELGSRAIVRVQNPIQLSLYAQNDIAEVWIIDLNAEAVQVWREPSALGYQQVQTFRRGQAIASQAFADAQFKVDWLLG